MPMIVFGGVLGLLAVIAIGGTLTPARVVEGLPADPDALAARDSLVGRVSLGFAGLRFGSALTGEAGPRRARGAHDMPRLAAAEARLERALERRRLEPRLHAALGHVALARGDLDRATRIYHAALDLSAGCTEARLGLGVTLAREALTQNDVMRTRGLLLQAIAQFTAVRRGSASYEDALYDRAMLLPDVGRRKEAAVAAAEYWARDSTSVWAERLHEIMAEEVLPEQR